MMGNVLPSHELLQEKLLVSNNEVLHSVIVKDVLLNEPGIVLTGF